LEHIVYFESGTQIKCPMPHKLSYGRLYMPNCTFISVRVGLGVPKIVNFYGATKPYTGHLMKFL